METIRSEKREPDNGNKIVIYIVVGIIALLLIGGIIFLVGRSSSDHKREKTDIEIIDDDEEDVISINKDSLRQAIADEKERQRLIEHQQVVDSLQRMADSLEEVAHRRVVTPTVPPTGRGTGTGAAGGGNGQGPLNLGYGTYEGPSIDGVAHGIGGTITFTKPYTIDLKKADGEVIEVGPGDKLVNVKMENGRIVQGLLIRADGSRRLIIIG